jgi:hypothetical protein
MQQHTRALTTATTALAIVFLGCSLVTPWAAAFPDRPDHYKLTLFGVRHVSDMGAHSAQTSCGWGDGAAPCDPAPTAGERYQLLILARWLVLGALALLVTALTGIVGAKRRSLVLPPLATSAIAIVCAILFIRTNAPYALMVFQDARIMLTGSGIVAAGGAAAAGVLSAFGVAVGRPAA